MRKSLSVLAVIAIIFAALGGALAVIPHTHGKDVDHSHHSSCPLYQISLHHFEAFVAALKIAVAFLFLSFLLLREVHLFHAPSPCSAYLRAPPAVL